MSNKIISITDIIENKVRKQKELEFYDAQLEDLKRKKFWICVGVIVVIAVVGWVSGWWSSPPAV